MRKIIHSDFELDLSDKKVTTVEQNTWFFDAPVLKYTYPFDFFLSDELDALFGFPSFHNTQPNTLFDIWHSYHDQLEQGVFEINEINDRTVSAELSLGIDNLPSWDKKLSELPLENLILEEEVTIYEHAEEVITETYPAVNYNFPQIHIDKIDTEDDVWFAFEGLINNRKDGAFLVNEVDTEEDITYNRNIMQPLPYLLHVLQVGAADAQKTLSGDILEDERLKKTLLYADVAYYTTIAQEVQNVFVMSEDRIETGILTGTLTSPESFNKYFVQLDIEQPGKYRLIGKVDVYFFRNFQSNLVLKYRNTVLRTFSQNGFIALIGKVTLNIDVIIETLSDLDPHFITLESTQRISTEKVIFELALNPIRLHDESGEAIPSIINLNQVDLKRAVPDITFGDLVKTISNWFNYDYDVDGDLFVMNKIQDEMNRAVPISMEQYEIKTPLRSFQRGISFLLKFQDIDSEDYQFQPVFHSDQGVTNSSFVTNDKTNTIEINAIPLPFLVRNGVQTAHAFDSGNAKVMAVLYDGLTDGKNISQDPSELLLPAVHSSDWFDWFEFRIKAVPYRWRFNAFYEDIKNLTKKSKIYAYGRFHFIKTIQKTEISPDLLEVEIEAES